MLKEQFDRMLLGGHYQDESIQDTMKEKVKHQERRKSKANVLSELTSWLTPTKSPSKQNTPQKYIPTGSPATTPYSKLVLEPIQTLEFTPESFDASKSAPRPSGWEAVRQRRMHKREQLDRLRGVAEETIIERRQQRTKEEEEAMVKEVLAYGNVVGVGGLSMEEVKKIARRSSVNRRSVRRPSTAAPAKTNVNFEKLDINPDTFDPSDPEKRPTGWAEVRRKRVYKREQLDRLRGAAEATLLNLRAQREQEEEALMLQEVAQYGNVLGFGGVKKPVDEEVIDPKELEMNFDPEDFDSSTNKRPRGWAQVKLRRVYMKVSALADIYIHDVKIVYVRLTLLCMCGAICGA